MYKVSIKVNKSLYPPEALLKAAYAFLETDYIHIDEDDKCWVVQLSPKTPETAGNNTLKEFENELLSQTVRLQVFDRTRSIREILLARAMTSTLLDEKDPIAKIQAEQGDISQEELESILTDWFDSNE